jgi:hypothetical protein
MPSTLDPAERRLRAQTAANVRWSKPGARQAQSEKIREVRLRQHEELVDPDGTLDPVERRKCAEASLRAEMARLRFRQSKARRARKTPTTAGNTSAA